MVFSFSWVEQVHATIDIHEYIFISLYFDTHFTSQWHLHKNGKTRTYRRAKKARPKRVESSRVEWLTMAGGIKIFMDKGVELNFAAHTWNSIFLQWKHWKCWKNSISRSKVLKRFFFSSFWTDILLNVVCFALFSLEWRNIRIKCCNKKPNFVFFN